MGGAPRRLGCIAYSGRAAARAVAVLDTLAGRCRFPAAGTAVTCAVSGGADSLALLALAVHAGCRVTAVHVDHGLRPGSAGEADVVRQAAARFGAAFEARSVEVSPGPNLEARARAARYGELPSGVLTGHTADDLAETVLLNLLRGAGLDGLAAMAAVRPSDGPAGPSIVPHRPLLTVRRAETQALCAALGLQPVADPMNHDPAFQRVRVRLEALPLLDDIAGRDVVAVLARQAALLADEAALLDELAESVDATDARALRAVPVALARRAVRRWLADAGYGAGHPAGAAVVERVLAVARGAARGTDLTEGWRVLRTAGRLRVLAPGPREGSGPRRGSDGEHRAGGGNGDRDGVGVVA